MSQFDLSDRVGKTSCANTRVKKTVSKPEDQTTRIQEVYGKFETVEEFHSMSGGGSVAGDFRDESFGRRRGGKSPAVRRQNTEGKNIANKRKNPPFHFATHNFGQRKKPHHFIL